MDVNSNLPVAAGSLLWSGYSAEARGLQFQSFNVAHDRLEAIVRLEPLTHRLAVVVDIDETILDNWPVEAVMALGGKGFDTNVWSDWVGKAKAQALPRATNFLWGVVSHPNVQVYYISSRDASQLEATIKNLHDQNCPMADANHVFLKTKTADGKRFDKRENRGRVPARIVLFIGDDLNDLGDAFEQTGLRDRFAAVDKNSSEFGRSFILLPNPIYGHWQAALWDQKPGDPEPRDKVIELLHGKKDKKH